MAWDAGTITDAAPWAALSTKIKALCGGSGAENWEFLENVPAGTGLGQSGSASYSLDVFVCHGTNSRPDDVGYVNKLAASDTNAGSSTSIVFAGVGALAANKVFTVVVSSTKATAVDDPTSVTLDGANAPTFTKIASKVGGDATGIVKVTVWLGKSSGSAPTGTNLTVAWATAQTGACCVLDEWTGLDESLGVTGIDASGTTQVCIQAANANGTNQTAQTVTAGALLDANSCLFMMNTQTASSGTYTPPLGTISSAATVTVATPNSCLRTALKPDAEQVAMTATLSSATSETSWAGIILELRRKTKTTAYGTLSDATVDWFFALEIPVPDGAVASSIGAFERYDPATGMKCFSSPCPLAGTGVTPVGTGYWRTFAYYPYANLTGLNRTNLAHQALNTSGFNYWIKLTRNSLQFATRVGVNEASIGAMLIDSFVANVTDACPLITSKMLASAGATNTQSRMPGVTTASASSSGWSHVVKGWTEAMLNANTYNIANGYDLWQNSKIHVGRLCVLNYDGASDVPNPATYGCARGLYKTDFLAVSNAGGTVNLGDTITIDGNTWTVIGYGFFGASNGSACPSQNVVLLVRAT